MEPEQPSPDTEHESGHEETHLPPPTLWPIGFAIGIVVVLVGLVIDPLLISTIGAVIAIVFGFLWVRDLTRDLRSADAPVPGTAPAEDDEATAEEEEVEKFREFLDNVDPEDFE